MKGNSSVHITKRRWNALSLHYMFQISILTSLLLVFTLSSLDLTCWLFNITFFKSIMPQWEPMEIITALCFVLASSGMLILQSDLPTIIRKGLPMFSAIGICGITLITIYVNLYSLNTGYETSITELSFFNFFLSHTVRMTLLPACNLLLISVVLILLIPDKKKISGIAQVLILPVFLTGYYTIVSNILGVDTSFKFGDMQVALNAGIAFFFICVAVFLTEPDSWLLKVFTSTKIGGLIAKRLIPAVLIIPAVIGWLRIMGEQKGLFESEYGVVLVAITYAVCFMALIWFTAKSLSSLDLKRRESEKALLESEERFKVMAEVSPVGMGVVDINDGTFLYINPAYKQYFGYGKDELLGEKTYEIYVDLQDRDLILKKLQRDKFVSNYEVKLKRKDGSSFWSLSSIKQINYNDSPAYLGTFIDITKRKDAEDALLYQASILGAVSDAVIGVDLSLNINYWNKAAEKIYGWKAEEVIGKASKDIVRSEMTQEQREAIHTDVLNGKPSFTELVQYTKDNKPLLIEGYTIPLKDSYGKTTSIVAINSDITEKKRAEIELKESGERFRTITESLPVMISINRIHDSIISFVNEPYEKTFGFKKGELTGKKMHNIFYYPQDGTTLAQILKEKGGIYNTEIKVKKSDGTPFWIMTSIRTIIYYNEPSYLTASIDITETKKTQEELIRLNHTLDAHSKSSQAMMHSNNELKYLNEVCKIIIEDCGYSMVWIGYAQNDKRKSVKPIAYYGFDQGYIDKLNVTWDDTERGSGPTGTAIKTGKPTMCKNMLTDPCFEPWREAALERGYASSLVLPLITDGRPFGAISIYSKEPYSFSDSEINLLSDLAHDLAYGISYLRLEESERDAARVIKENEAKLKELVATKDKFFNIVAHDLKNPFTSLLGSSELLFQNIHKMDIEQIKELTLILNDSAKSGYAILQNLLDWSRSQTGMLKVNPERINLKKIIDESIYNLELSSTIKEIEIYSID
jgi:PAS domain S-box-containing protein